MNKEKVYGIVALIVLIPSASYFAWQATLVQIDDTYRSTFKFMFNYTMAILSGVFFGLYGTYQLLWKKLKKMI